jgi:hypothetical protein
MVKSHDKIYFCWLPKKTDNGFIWLTWVRDVVISFNGSPYILVKREKYQYTKNRVFRYDK